MTPQIYHICQNRCIAASEHSTLCDRKWYRSNHFEQICKFKVSYEKRPGPTKTTHLFLGIRQPCAASAHYFISPFFSLPNTLLRTKMSQYNIAACGYDKHPWTIFVLWCYEVSWMCLISTTKAVIEFEGGGKGLFSVPDAMVTQTSNNNLPAQSTGMRIISDTIFQAKLMIGGWTNQSGQSHAAALTNATRV